MYVERENILCKHLNIFDNVGLLLNSEMYTPFTFLNTPVVVNIGLLQYTPDSKLTEITAKLLTSGNTVDLLPCCCSPTHSTQCTHTMYSRPTVHVTFLLTWITLILLSKGSFLHIWSFGVRTTTGYF